VTLALYLGTAILVAWAAGRLVPIDRRVIGVFVLLPLLFLLPGLVGSRTVFPVDQVTVFPPWNSSGASPSHNPNLNDAVTQFAPWAKAVRMAWKEGSLPLRDRWNGCGMALAANGQSAAFSPFTFVTFLVPLAHAFDLLAALRLFLALLGTWLWLCELGVSPDAALYGAVGFAFSLSMTGWLLFPHTAVLCLWPWCLWLIERALSGSASRRTFAALVAALTLLPLAGHLETVVSLVGFLIVWFGARLAAGERMTLRRVRRIAVAGGLAGGLTAFVLIPQALTILASNRFILAQAPLWTGAFSWLPHAAVWRKGLWTTLFPRVLGDAMGSPMIDGRAGSFPEMSLAYCGLISFLGLFLLGRPGGPRERRILLLAVPLLFGLGVAIGAWPFAELAGHAPLLKWMLPLRFFTWVALAAPAIAAAEFDRLRSDLEGSARPLAAVLLIAAALAALAVAGYRTFAPLHAAAGGLSSQRHALTVSLTVLGAAALAAVGASANSAARRMLPLALAALTAVELAYQGRRLYAFGSPAALFPETPAVRFLRAQTGPFRVAGRGATVFPGTNVFAGVESVGTHDPVERRDYVELLDAAAGYPPTDYFKFIGHLDAPLLDFLNVRFLVSASGLPAPGPRWTPVYSGADASVFENRNVLPRAFAPARLRLVPGRLHAPSAVDAFGPAFAEMARRSDWSETAWILAAGTGAVVNGPATVSGYRERTNGASFEVASPSGSRVLVVTSLVQDGGWRARDDSGRELETTRANGPFVAVWASGLKTRVELDYCPPGLSTGAGVSLFIVLVAGASALKKRRSPKF
jgi:hypothetical protein